MFVIMTSGRQPLAVLRTRKRAVQGPNGLGIMSSLIPTEDHLSLACASLKRSTILTKTASILQPYPNVSNIARHAAQGTSNKWIVPRTILRTTHAPWRLATTS